MPMTKQISELFLVLWDGKALITMVTGLAAAAFQL